MDDLISRQAAINAADMTDYTGLAIEDVKAVTDQVVKELKKFPSAERRGRWEHLGGDEWFCSACGYVTTTEGSWERPWQKYCEECGAKMDEVE